MSKVFPSLFAIVLTASALTACSPPILNQQNEAQSIRSASSEWQHAIAARDSDRVMASFSADAVLIMPHAPRATGLSAVRSVFRGILGIPGLELTWVPTRIEVMSATAATEYGSYILAYDTPQGKANDAGNYINIWHKINGNWLVTLHSFVTSRPLPR